MYLVMSLLSSMTEPDAGFRNPLITLNSVDLPAPFGPRIPTISPDLTERSTEFREVMPPNWIVRSMVSSSGSRRSVIDSSPQLHEHPSDGDVQHDRSDHQRDAHGRTLLDQRELLLPDLQKAARPEQQQDDQQRRRVDADERAEELMAPEDLRLNREDDRAEERTPRAIEATDDDQDDEGDRSRVGARRLEHGGSEAADRLEQERQERPAHARQDPADDERRELRLRHVDAERLGLALVVAHRPHAP